MKRDWSYNAFMLLIPQVVYAVLTSCAFQHGTHDLESNHWVFRSFKELAKCGLLLGMEEDLARGRAPMLGRGARAASTYDVAVGAYSVMSTLKDKANELERDCKAPSLMHSGPTVRATVDKANLELKKRNGYIYGGQVVIPIIDFTTSELKQLDGDPRDMKTSVNIAIAKLSRAQVTKPGSALVQFRDVPSSHWAASAVLDLRSKGLLLGYPDDKYQP